MKKFLAVLMVLTLVGLALAPAAQAASFNKFENAVDEILLGRINTAQEGHTLKVYLSNTTPSASADAGYGDLAEISTGNGYTGPEDITNDMSETSGTATVTGVDVVITASGGTVGPFQYVILMDDDPDTGTGCTASTVPYACCTGSGTGTCTADPLIGWWDYGSAVTLQNAETFTVDFGASVFTLN